MEIVQAVCMQQLVCITNEYRWLPSIVARCPQGTLSYLWCHQHETLPYLNIR